MDNDGDKKFKNLSVKFISDQIIYREQRWRRVEGRKNRRSRGNWERAGRTGGPGERGGTERAKRAGETGEAGKAGPGGPRWAGGAGWAVWAGGALKPGAGKPEEPVDAGEAKGAGVAVWIRNEKQEQ